MKKVYVYLDDACKSLLSSHGFHNLGIIEEHGKLEDFYNLVDELFNDDVELSELDKWLVTDFQDICQKLGIDTSTDTEYNEMEESLNLDNLNKLLAEALQD